MAYRKSFGERVSDLFIGLAVWSAILITLYPFIYVASMSVSDLRYVVDGTVWLLPKGFSLDAYERIFENSQVGGAYLNSIFITVTGTLINIVMTLLAAYPLSRPRFYMRHIFMALIVFTMFFGGGLIPMFILVNKLGLYNTYWAVLLPGAVSAFLIIIARTFLQSIPDSLYESVKLDGANDIRILWSIVIPLSKPIISVLALFYAVGHWNSYFSALLYLYDIAKQPLSLYMVKVLMQGQDIAMQGITNNYERSTLSIQLKYAIIMAASLPIIMIYPFLQKHFIKGVLIGSLKE